MVVGAIIAGVIIGGLILYALMSQPPGGDDMSPNTLDSFQMTSTQEGKVVPLVFGKTRVNSNLLWYGNLETEEQTEDAGGKGGGGDDITTGYKYWMDLWHGICEGPGVTLEGIYVQDKAKDVSALGTYFFNPGDTGYYPTEPGDLAAPLNPVAHVFLDRYYLGENVSNVPTLHFIVERLGQAPITYANITGKGVNPASIIYELFTRAGASFGDFDLTYLQEAATYWNSKGYGMNITFSKQEELRNMIKRVFSYVDGAVYFNEQDKIVVRAFRDSDTSVKTINEDKFKTFQFTRRTWDDVFTDFRANFVDEDAEYTKRTIRVRNSAVHALIGYEKQKTVDLTAFRGVDTASKRLWEIMKQYSYPEAQVTAKLGIEYSGLNIGDIVTLNHSDYGISGMEFRVWEKDMSEIDSNEISFRFMQYLESLFDANYTGGGGTVWQTPSYAPLAAQYQKVYELPFNNQYGQDAAYLILAARQGQEDGFVLEYTPTGADYATVGQFRTFSQRGTLDQIYPVTIAIDDTDGILYTPYRDDPIFNTMSRAELFSKLRFALLGGTELVGFQTVTPEGVNSFRLTGIIRGVLNTPVSSHAAGTEIWLTNLADNVYLGAGVSDFYLKIRPKFGAEVVDAASVTPVHVVGVAKALTPWPINRVEAVRSGSTVTVEVTPTSQLFFGAGVEPGSTQTDQYPPAVSGDYQWYLNILATVIHTEATNQWSYVQSTFHYIYVRQRRGGKWSDWKGTRINPTNGTYIGPTD